MEAVLFKTGGGSFDFLCDGSPQHALQKLKNAKYNIDDNEIKENIKYMKKVKYK